MEDIKALLDDTSVPPKPLRRLTREEQTKIDELAMYFFDGSGDVMAVSHSLRNLILARFEWVAKHGKDSGE